MQHTVLPSISKDLSFAAFYIYSLFSSFIYQLLKKQLVSTWDYILQIKLPGKKKPELIYVGQG